MPAQGRKQQPVRSLPAWTAQLSFQDPQLLPEHHDLQLQRTIPPTGHQDANEQQGKAVDQSQEHRLATMPDSPEAAHARAVRTF